MRRLLLLIAVCLPAPAGAQECVPVYGWGQTLWSNDAANPGTYPPNANSAHVFGEPVPAGQIWKMRTIALATDDGRTMEYFIEHLTNKPPNPFPNYHRIAGGIGSGTPPMHVSPADAAALVLLPGERLAGRSNAPNAQMVNRGMLLLYSYFSFAEACLGRALGMSSAGTTGSTSFAALVQAAQAAATAFNAVAESAP